MVGGASQKKNVFLQISQNVDGFRQNNSQGFSNSYYSVNKTH